MIDVVLFLVFPVAAIYAWYLIDTGLIPSFREKINDKKRTSK